MRAAEDLGGEPWAMEPEALLAMARRLSSAEPSAGPRTPTTESPPREPYELRGSTAVIRIEGVLMRRPSFWAELFGMRTASLPEIRQAVERAADDARARTILLRIDSPGGQARGVLEVANAIYDARARKRVEALVDGMAASGAYWLASQAHEITASPDAVIGSIGVYQVWEDSSKAAEREGIVVHVLRSGEHKGAGEPGAPMTPVHLAGLQQLVDGMGDLFLAAVERGRRLSPEQTQIVATGQAWLAADAQRQGLVDHLEPVTRAFSRLAPMEVVAMSDDTTKAKDPAEEARVAAATAERRRFADLRAAFPRDLEYAAKAYDKGETVAEAKAAYCDVLEGKLADAAKAATSAREEAVKTKTLAASVPPSAPPVPRGGDPAASTGEDFLAAAREYAQKHAVKIVEAMRAIARAKPDLHTDYLASMRERAPAIAARKRAIGMA